MKRHRGLAGTVVTAPFTLKIRVRGHLVSLRLTPDFDSGGYVVTSPSLRGLNTQGDSIDEALMNGREAAEALLTEPHPRPHA